MNSMSRISLSSCLRQGIVAGLTVAALSFSLALSQFSTGQISGYVKDSTGLVVPGVMVVATNEGTGLVTRAVTNSLGYYVFPTLMAATYTITVEMPGFKRFSVNKIEVTGAAKISVDAQLELGQVTEVVEVQADSAAVQSESATLGQLVGRREIDELPASGGNAVTFARLRAGVIGGRMSDFAGTSINTGVTSISGSRPMEVMVMVDGAIANRTRSTDNTMLGFQDAQTIQEVEVLTANYSAEYGRGSGGVIRMVTRSGTRDFHGTFTELFQNSALNANTWARNASGNPRLSKQPAYRYNQFGFVLSGPIYIPGVFNNDRSRIFFTWGESWIRRGSESTATRTVPTAKMRGGDLSELLDPGNTFFRRTRVVNDPLTGKPFPDNIIPASRLSPMGKNLVNFYPLPTPGFLEGTSNWIGTFASWQRQQRDTLRIDFAITSRHNLTFRGTRIPYNFRDEDVRNGAFNSRPNRTAVAALISTYRSFINEFTVSMNSDGYGTMERDPECGPRCDRSTYGLNYPFLYPASLKLAPEKPPSITITGLSTFDFGPYPGFWAGQILAANESMTKIIHSHTLKWGIIVERSGQNDKIQRTGATAPQTANENGQFRFLDSGHPQTTGLAMGNALLGYFNDYSEIGPKPMTPFVATTFDAFLQDSWKVTRKLSVEIGVRYSLWPTWYSKWNTLSMFHPEYFDVSQAPKLNPKDGSIISGTGDRYNGIVIPGAAPLESALSRFPFLKDFTRLYHGDVPRGFSPTHKNNFTPRLGIGYALNSKTAIRAGGGMFLNRLAVNRDTALGGNPPFEEGTVVFNGVADYPGGATRRDFPFSVTMQDPVLKVPVAWTWNVTMQRQLPHSIGVEAAYVGRRAYHNQRKRNLNQAQPGSMQANPGVNTSALMPFYGMGIVGMSENAGVSRYNGLQLSVERRLASGFGFNLSYTRSKNKDNATTEDDPLPNPHDDRGFYGNSSLDRPHVLMVTYMYNVPALKSGGPLRAVFRDWAISSINQFQSGAPFTVEYAADYAGIGAGSGPQFWDQVGDPKVERTPFTSSTVWFNKAAFAQPKPGTFGVQPRNGLRHPGFWEINVSFRRSFRFAETRSLDFRWEAFNMLNHPNLGSAQGNPTSGSFGLVTSKTGVRSMQFLLQFKF